jgi:hypothetical protein
MVRRRSRAIAAQSSIPARRIFMAVFGIDWADCKAGSLLGQLTSPGKLIWRKHRTENAERLARNQPQAPLRGQSWMTGDPCKIAAQGSIPCGSTTHSRTWEISRFAIDAGAGFGIRQVVSTPGNAGRWKDSNCSATTRNCGMASCSRVVVRCRKCTRRAVAATTRCRALPAISLSPRMNREDDRRRRYASERKHLYRKSKE